MGNRTWWRRKTGLAIAAWAAIVCVVAYVVYPRRDASTYISTYLHAVHQARQRDAGTLTRPYSVDMDALSEAAAWLSSHREEVVLEVAKSGASGSDQDRANACLLLELVPDGRGLPVLVDYIINGKDEEIASRAATSILPSVVGANPAARTDEIRHICAAVYESEGKRVELWATWLPDLAKSSVPELLTDPDIGVRCGAAIVSAIAGLGPDTLDFGAEDEDAQLVRACAALYSDLDEPANRRAVEFLTRSSDEHLRAWAVACLKNTGWHYE